MLRRHRLLFAGLAVVVVLVVAAAAGYIYFFGSSAPSSASIDQAVNSLASSDPSAQASLATTDGTWNVDTSIGSFSDFSSTWAGFRVQEVLSNIGNNTAIGRTPNVSGTLSLNGQTLMNTKIDVDLTSIKSDQALRDPRIQQALSTGQFPTATFELTSPVSLPQAPVEGVTYNLNANGNMTIHGVTKAVSAMLQAQLKNGVIVVVGSIPFTFEDYGMSPPQAPIVLSVSDNGTIEFQLYFTHS